VALGDQPVQDGHGRVGVQPALDGDGEGLAGVLIHAVEQLEDPPVLDQAQDAAEERDRLADERDRTAGNPD
jgi:hypothetical protein